MNALAAPRQPWLALVDDDSHSARLMTRMLLAHGAPSIQWLDDADEAAAELRRLLADPHVPLPGLVIVDLRSSSRATADFIRTVRAVPGARALTVAAVAPAPRRPLRDLLLGAGADAVFERHPDIGDYRREAAAILGFWVRNHRLHAVGA